jgi:hypothetical protein
MLHRGRSREPAQEHAARDVRRAGSHDDPVRHIALGVFGTLRFVNPFDLGPLASIGSAASIAVFVLVGAAIIRLQRTIGAHLPILLAGVLFSIVVLVFPRRPSGP